MGRRRYRRKKYHSRTGKISEEERFQWLFAITIFILAFILYFSSSFITNCMWEWPPRWDVGTCWNEQIDPAKEKAMEKAIQFIP